MEDAALIQVELDGRVGSCSAELKKLLENLPTLHFVDGLNDTYDAENQIVSAGAFLMVSRRIRVVRLLI
jgi:hypothetical protein